MPCFLKYFCASPFYTNLKIQRWGNKQSPYIFGYLKGQENETYIFNNVKKTKKRIIKPINCFSLEFLEVYLPVVNSLKDLVVLQL